MATYNVEVVSGRLMYAVEASSAQDAMDNWAGGTRMIAPAAGLSAVSAVKVEARPSANTHDGGATAAA